MRAISMRERIGKWRAGPANGVELLEFALVLPLLLLLVVGVWDFGSAFLLRDKMTNAAREAARIVVSTPLNTANCPGPTPCTIVAGANALVQYMNHAGHDASCIDPGAPSDFTAPARASYSCRSGVSLVIDRGVTVAVPDDGLIPATRVTLTWPVRFKLAGFLPSAFFPATITTTVTMQNLTN
jgi:hypothetical protein